MTVRESIEEREKDILSPYATLSVNSRGRENPDEPCDLRPVFQRDRDRILHCKAFRRLKDKTQVFLTPNGDHYRTRLTHTLEVSQNARTIAKALALNEDLVEAIALGHDLGHTPFGHAGERALASMGDLSEREFEHNEQSVRVVKYLEKDGNGLNLTWEVIDGIREHQTSGSPSTLEGKVVRYSDKIAYTFHDMDDAIRGGILTEKDVPKEICEIIGYSSIDRLDGFIHDIITYSKGKNDVCMSPDVDLAMKALRGFMFERVYTNPEAKDQEGKAEDLVRTLYDYYETHFDEVPRLYQEIEERGASRYVAVCDYISSMTDRFAIAKYEDMYIPKCWHG